MEAMFQHLNPITPWSSVCTDHNHYKSSQKYIKHTATDLIVYLIWKVMSYQLPLRSKLSQSEAAERREGAGPGYLVTALTLRW